MIYVKKDNVIFAYESSQRGLYDKAISEGGVAISENEANEMANPPRVEEQQPKLNKQLRLIAYKEESDPLFIEWQYDNAEEKERLWREKVHEIKLRYPVA
ncbi:hypothetical protein [uncultured Vibrio sp.]|uniref:hypothetical protein n=1 Tax=uncultured Vibrio sp. TaxID=114054 RepID=UPI002628A176|nr:hypothetical protein [uncultured Vibrio sp.]